MFWKNNNKKYKLSHNTIFYLNVLWIDTVCILWFEAAG